MKTLILEFPDAYPGEKVELIISPVPIRSLLDIVAKRAEVVDNDRDLETLLTTFTPFIASWTFPEPVGLDGLLARDLSLVATLLDAWVEGVRDVPRPLWQASTAGTPSEAK